MRKFCLWIFLMAGGAALTVAFGVAIFSREEENVPVTIIGVHHLGDNYSIPDFYVNRYSGANVGREGGGGGMVCCIVIPLKWRPGLVVEVRWEVTDWSQENRSEIETGNYESLRKEGVYIANVPVEKYENPGSLYVHFFPGGRVRVVTTLETVLSSAHPIRRGPRDGGENSTSGLLIKEMFTKAELRDAEGRDNKWK